VESEILKTLSHPSCFGLDEIGLDHQYTFSPLDVQQTVFAQQLPIAMDRGISRSQQQCIHEKQRRIQRKSPRKSYPRTTRYDCLNHPPSFQANVYLQVHVHYFTFDLGLLWYFPHLRMGLTAVVCYSQHCQTMSAANNKRILLETDAPSVVLANVYGTLQSRLPFSHSLTMTAEFVANVVMWSRCRTCREGICDATNCTCRA
ncbi:uncharacterized protein EV420DRAFT_1280533, partial [Desarmillaria tabescens]